MQVIIIGSGNIAGLMGEVLLKNGHRILQVYSRNPVHASQLALKLQAAAVSEIAGIEKNADIYIIAISDDAIPVVAAELALGDKFVVHTSGTVSTEVLNGTSSRYGVLWPVKMVRSSTATFAPATMVVDGNSKEVTAEIARFATIFSPNVEEADDEKRAKMHLTATFLSNFTNHLLHVAADYCEKENIPFNSFLPLMNGVVENLSGLHPALLQAGPAFRGDMKTISKHLSILETEPEMKKIYGVMTESIMASVGG